MSDPPPTIEDVQRAFSTLNKAINKVSADIGRTCYAIGAQIQKMNAQIAEGLRRRHQQRTSFIPPHVPHVSGYELTCSTCGKSPEEH